MNDHGRIASFAVAVALSTPAGLAAASSAPPGDSAPSRTERREDPPALPSVGITMLAGLALPACDGLGTNCAGGLDAGPSLQGFVLFQPTETWAFGIVGQLARTHWHATYPGMTDGGRIHGVASDLTNGFVGLAARIVLLPRRPVSPVIQLAFASAFQSQTGSNINCNNGLTPTGQAGLGARTRVGASFALYSMASATTGFKLENCSVSDGPPATPFGGWGYGFHVGASFDLR